MTTDAIELAWVAGIFEGEGCLYWNPGRKGLGPNGKIGAWRINLTMCDRDVVARFQRACDWGYIKIHRVDRSDVLTADGLSTHRDQWTLTCGQRGRVREFTDAIQHHLMERRSRKVEEFRQWDENNQHRREHRLRAGQAGVKILP